VNLTSKRGRKEKFKRRTSTRATAASLSSCMTHRLSKSSSLRRQILRYAARWRSRQRSSTQTAYPVRVLRLEHPGGDNRPAFGGLRQWKWSPRPSGSEKHLRSPVPRASP